MALTLTDPALRESEKVNLNPQIVFEIEGVETLFGAVEIFEYIVLGDDLFIGDDWIIGGLTSLDGQEDIISLDGTSTTIQQQLRPDQGSISSISSVMVSLIDPNNIATRLISPGVEIEDILARKATLYMGFRDTAWPDDYVEIFAGIVDDVESLPGKINFNIAHPEAKKRQEIFIKADQKLAVGVNASDTSFTLDNAAPFLVPVAGPDSLFDTAIKFYIRIDDEIIKYTGRTGNTLTGGVRAQLTTVANSHAIDASVSSFYVLEDDMITLALKVMLSGVNDYFVTGVEVEAFNQVSPSENVAGAIFFEGLNVKQKYGIIEGDYVTTSGATNGANNVTLKAITDIVVTELGSYIVVSEPIVTEIASPALVSFRSKYDTLGEGLAMNPDDVDVEEHEYWRGLILTTFSMRHYLKDTMNAKEFIDKQVYAPYGAYSVPRKGRVSMGYHIGPIPRGEIPILDNTNIKSPSQIKLRRTINRNFYNTIVYAFDQDSLEDKFLAGVVYVSADSKSRIPIGNKVLRYDSQGIRTDLLGVSQTERASQRLLSRYRFGAEHFETIHVLFKTGFTIEPGDLVLFEPGELKISNTSDGTRVKESKFFEVINKSMNLKTGEVTLALVDTNFDKTERYGVISPSSVIASGTDTFAIIEDSYGEVFPDNEPKKWRDYAGLPVLIHSEDFSFQEEIVFTGFDPSNRYKMLFDTVLSQPVQAGWIVDIAPYSSSTDPKVNRRYKLFHAHWCPTVDVTAGVSDVRFTVGAGDISKFNPGLPVRVHTEDFTIFSPEVIIDSTIGNDVLVRSSLGFTPAAGQFASLIGFPDLDHPYRWF